MCCIMCTFLATYLYIYIYFIPLLKKKNIQSTRHKCPLYCRPFWNFIVGFDVLKNIYLWYTYQKPYIYISIYLYSSFRSSSKNRSILACLIHIHIRKGSIKYCLFLLWARLKIYCISILCCVWNNVYVHVCKTNCRFIIICNCIYNAVINCDWWMDGVVLGWWLKVVTE